MKSVVVAALALLLAACGGARPATDSTGTVAPTGTTQPTATPSAVAPPKTVIGSDGRNYPVIDRDGTYLVWLDIPFGKYRSPGGPQCYWARLNSADTRDIIDSKQASGPQEIQIRASDTAFTTQHCGTWQLTSFQ